MRRRNFIGGAFAATILQNRIFASTYSADGYAPETMLFRGATVVSLDPHIGTLDKGDILIERGRITAVGRSIRAEAAVTLDATGLLAMPGFVDTHWHMWNTIARSYAPTMAEAVDCGITTIHNFAHNICTPEHADAEIKAMLGSGLRGRFSYGYPQSASPSEKMNFKDVLRVRDDYFEKGQNRFDLGIATRGPERTPASIWKEEFLFARKESLPVTTHVEVLRDTSTKKAISQLQDARCLGPNTMLVHLTQASAAEMQLASKARTPVVVTPWTEMRVGYGLTPWSQLSGLPDVLYQ